MPLSLFLSYSGDAEDVLGGAVVVGQLCHPVKLGGHIAQPVDRVVRVALDYVQHFLVLLLGHLQQLTCFTQLNVQLPDTGAV